MVETGAATADSTDPFMISPKVCTAAAFLGTVLFVT